MGSAADWYRQPLARREGLVQAMIEARSNNGPDARSAAVPEAGRNVRVEAHEAYLDLLKGFLRSLYNPLHD
jgi:hypothetical protein